MKKKQNTFKFVGFNDRISAIHIDSALRYKATAAQPLFAESFFFEALEKWSDLDGTSDFDKLKRSIPKYDLQTYAQVLHHQKQIIDALKTHLMVEGSLCLPATFDLVIAICRDLQSDFYPYFWDFFDILKSILERSTLQDVDLLEKCFSCYAYLFRYCWRQLCTELSSVLHRFLPLISHKRSYIRRFSAESLSFLIRKCKDFNSFLPACVKSIENNEATLESMGQLLYETVKGVKHALHSIAPEIYEALLILCEQDSTICIALIAEELSAKLCANKSPDSLLNLVDILVNRIRRFTLSKDTAKVAKNLLSLCVVWLSDKRLGKFCYQRLDAQFLEICQSFVEKGHLHDDRDLLAQFLRFLHKLLNSGMKNCDFSHLLGNLLALDSDGHLFDLFSEFLRPLLLNDALFETICSQVFTYVHNLLSNDVSDELSRQLLDFYCELCDRKIPLWDCFDSDESMGQKFGFIEDTLPVPQRILSLIEGVSDTEFEHSNPLLLHRLFLYPFFRKHIQKRRLLDALKQINSLQDTDLVRKVSAFVLMLRALHCGKVDYRSCDVDFEWFFTQLKCNPGDLLSLKAFECLLTTFPAIHSDGQLFDDIRLILQSNLFDCNTAVRIKTIEILSALDIKENQSVYNLMLKCEQIPLDLQSYRERLLIYKKLSALEYEKYLQENTSFYRSLVVKFLVGQLNVNFTLILPMLKECIESHARSPAQNEFWDVYKDVLSCIQKRINCTFVSHDLLPTSSDDKRCFLQSLFMQFCGSANDVISYLNFRLRLWQTMERFADLAGSKSRCLSDLLLELAEVELKIGCSGKHVENFTKSSIKQNFDKETERTILSYKYRTLTSCLIVYSKFSNIKNVAKENRLKELYLRLLMNGRPDVQKAALDCILAYKSNSLEPYRDHLYGLLIDKQFKDELVLFNVDSESNVVAAEHRDDILKVLLRLLYGRLLGKGSDNQRKEQIYRFLAGCRENELAVFLDYLFEPLQEFINSKESIDEICLLITKSYDFSESIPFRKIKGILAHLSLVVKRLNFSIGKYSTKIMAIICILGAIFCKIRAERETLQAYYVKAGKRLLQDLLSLVAQFFTHFERYSFDCSELKCLFRYCLRPMLDKLDPLYVAPNEILNLARIWSEVPRFHPLLALYDASATYGDGCCATVLDLVLASLHSNASPSKFTSNRYESISQILVNLIETSEADVDLPYPDNFKLKTVGSLKTSKMQTISESTMLTGSAQKNSVDNRSHEIVDDELGLGAEIVLTHSATLLDFIVRRSVNPSKNPLCQKERWSKILSLLTRWLDDAANVTKLLSILLPIVKAKIVKNPVVEAELISSVDSLLRKVPDKETFLIPVAEMLGSISNRQSRDALMLLLKNVSNVVTDLQPIFDIIVQMNSWDSKRIEEPDFETRIKAFSAVQKILKREQANILLSDVHCCFLVYNCLHLVSQAGDLALRDNAGFTLRLIVDYASKVFEANVARSFLSLHILTAFKVEMKSKEEPVRHEMLRLLGACVKSFGSHPKLLGMSALTDIDDPDLNFFDNVTHIQLHRRSRGIRRVCDKLELNSETATKIHSEILFTYFWPICYSFIFDATYAKNSMLIEESIRFLSVYCKRASWKRYESMLKYYLMRLRKDADRQKILVKMIAAILNAFHFDIKVEQTTLPSVEETHVCSTEANVDQTTEIQKLENRDGKKKAIFDSIATNFIPELRNCLVKRTSTDIVHKSMKKSFYDEDEEILRVPLALALLKLLQKLGDECLENNLPNVLTKICHMLKSRSWDIRETTRKVLCQIGQSLGARYLPYIIKEMRGVLTRGYQSHVLTYSVNVLLNAMAEQLQPGDLDPCVNDILAICNEDLFGQLSEQKEADEITKRLKEARACKGAGMYKLLGCYISCSYLDIVIQPLQEVLETRFVHKSVVKVQDALRNLAQGLILNQGMQVEFLMVYIHKLLRDNVPRLNCAIQPDSDAVDGVAVDRTSSCLIIEPAPQRCGVLPKRSKTLCLHILVLFALDILDSLLKTGRLKETNAQHCSMLDPYLSIFVQCFEAKQTRVIALSMRCLLQSLKFAMPSFKDVCLKIVQHIFILLSRFAGLASSGGENQELLSVLFKTITAIVKESDNINLNAGQLKVLLNYVEEDLYDNQKQSTAFNLIKAILSRKLICPEIKNVMECIEKLCIESPSDSVRESCRSVLHKYVINYPAGQRPRRFVDFFCAQLSYEYESGRDSALEALQMIIETAKPIRLYDCALLIFVHLALPLINDESSRIRRKVSVVLRKLLDKVDAPIINSMLQMVFDWLADKKVMHKKLAVHLLGLFVEKLDAVNVEKAIQQCLHVCDSIMEDDSTDDDCASEQQRSTSDHVIYLTLVFVEKLLVDSTHCQLVRNKKFTKSIMDRVWVFSIRCLGHAHSWVQYSACRLLGVLFAHFKPEELLNSDLSSNEEYFVKNSREVIKSLCLEFIRLLRTKDCSQDLAEQIIKNLVFVAHCVRVIWPVDSSKMTKNSVNCDDVEKRLSKHPEDTRASLKWLVVQMTRISRFEIAQFPDQIVRRNSVFKWFASLVLDTDQSLLSDLVPLFLPCLYREITLADSADETLKNLSSEVVEIIKSKLGMENFVQYWAAAHAKSTEKRIERKRKIAQEAVANPEKASKRKIRQNKMQRETKKRKLLLKQGKMCKGSKRFKTKPE